MTTRIFQAVPLAPAMSVQLAEPASHHLTRVLRKNVGDEIVVFNGLGGEFSAQIQRIDKKSVTVMLGEFDNRTAESPLDLYLAQGISRGEKMDYTIQKAVELGVKKIIPLFTERCNVKLDQERSEKKHKHWQSIVVSACEQSGRNTVPDILLPQTLEAWANARCADYLFVLSPTAQNPLADIKIPASASVVVLIGPEGGLSEKEIAYLLCNGFSALSLGPRILRTETAAVAVLSALQCCFGDMS